jgi:hypothetical protein
VDAKTGKIVKAPPIPPFSVPAIQRAASNKAQIMRKNAIREGVIAGVQSNMTPDQIAKHGDNIKLRDAIVIVAETLTDQVVMQPMVQPSARVKAAEFLLKHSELAAEPQQAGQQAGVINNMIVSDAAFVQAMATKARIQGNDE